MGNPLMEPTLGKVKILGGDVGEGTWNVKRSGLTTFMGAIVFAEDFETVTPVTEENRYRLGRTAGTAAVGGLLLGPIGLLGGALFGKKQHITFLATLDGDRQVLGQTDPKGFQAILRYTL